jgi:hypothetical protein
MKPGCYISKTIAKFSIVAILISLAFAGCAEKTPIDTSWQGEPWPLKTTKGSRLETEHYIIYTTVNDSAFHQAAVTLAETQYARFHDLIAAEPKQKMTVYIFANPRQWVAFTQHRFRPEIAEMYLRIRNGGYTSNDFAAFYMMGRYATLTVMAHELFHLYLNLATSPEPVPAWINEGLASYFEAHEWNGEVPVFTPTKNLFRRQQLGDAMAKDQLFSLKELLDTNAGDVCRKYSQDRVLTYYAQLWGLMVYLQDPSSPYHKPFEQLLAELGTHSMTIRIKGYQTTLRDSDNVGLGQALFLAYLCSDPEKFERDCNEYLQKLAGY